MIETKNENALTLEEEFDLRERRLKLIYKILYVVAVGLGVIFVSYAEQPTRNSPIYCGILAVLVSFLVNLLSFIFSEFRCIKICGKTDNETKNNAEQNFSCIWNSLAKSALVSLILTIVNILLIQYTSLPISEWFVAFPIGIALGILSIVCFFYKGNNKAKEITKSISIPIICYCMFAIVQTVEVI